MSVAYRCNKCGKFTMAKGTLELQAKVLTTRAFEPIDSQWETLHLCPACAREFTRWVDHPKRKASEAPQKDQRMGRASAGKETIEVDSVPIYRCGKCNVIVQVPRFRNSPLDWADMKRVRAEARDEHNAKYHPDETL